MRPTLTALPLLFASSLALAQGNMCALPSAAQAQPVAAAEDPNGGFPVIPAAEIAASPALARLASTGARLLDLGRYGGTRIVVAINGNSIAGFTVDPEGRYLTAGPLYDGAEPDKDRRNITLNLARRIPGAVPTVDMRQGKPQAGAPAADADVLAESAKATFGIIGNPEAPRLWVYIDPLCVHSVRAWDEFKPAIAAGKLHLAVVPVPVLDHRNSGRSTPAAARLVAATGGDVAAAWAKEIDAERRGQGGAAPLPPDEAREGLRQNMLVATRIGMTATPTMVWKDSDEQTGRFVGDGQAAAILASMGVK